MRTVNFFLYLKTKPKELVREALEINVPIDTAPGRLYRTVSLDELSLQQKNNLPNVNHHLILDKSVKCTSFSSSSFSIFNSFTKLALSCLVITKFRLPVKIQIQ